MENRKKKQSITDQINETLKPKELTEENDNIEARFEEFDENIETFNQSSSIRRQQAKELSELDSKYEGKATSRKELELESGSEEDNFDNKSIDDEISESDESLKSSADGDDEDFGDFDLSQLNKRSEQIDEAKLIKETQEEVQKSVCVQNQLKIWEKLLEVRIKAQKMLISANSLPDYDAYHTLCEEDGDGQFLKKYESACDNLHNLLHNLVDLQEILIGKFPESKDVLKGAKRKVFPSAKGILKRSKLAEYSDRIEDNYDAYKEFSIPILQKWHDRTKIMHSKNASNMTIMNKIESALLGKKEMIRKTQIYRGDYDIIGVERPQNENGEIEVAEIFDDSDFYHQLLRELIEYKSNVDDNHQSEITQKFIELQKVRSKMKKKIETRASKGRKIRYNVHNKLVNFMPPKERSEWTEDAKTELFNSLFGTIKQ